MSQINQRIAALRSTMSTQNIDAYIIPSSDPHQSEYTAPYWQARNWISGFTGSAGTVVITHDHAGLWTDSRYFLQAEQELANSEMTLHRLTIPHTAEHLNWLVEQLPDNSTIGFDSSVFSVNQVRQISRVLHHENISFYTEKDLLQNIWTDRPPLPQNEIFALPIENTGQSRADKINTICDTILSKSCQYHLVTSLDDIAWILNIRSNDVECNPVTIAYLIIGAEKSILFIDKGKISEDLHDQFLQDGIILQPYTAITSFLQELDESQKIWIDPSRINHQLFNAIPEISVYKGETISTTLKARKNPIEVSNIKKAMLKDGVALTKLFRWLNAELEHRGITEVEVAQQLDEFRRTQGDYHGESFAAIVGYKGNGAIVHYRAKEGSCATLAKEGILLLDSGGQYLQGTTDITRTIALGTPTEEQKRNFTLVLKGHIALAQLKFPEGTHGNQMEILARQALWQYGLNYGHGTGHGVGHFLNVHEGPQSIGSGVTGKAAVPFEEGMFTSNEPGYYKEGEYGIRIENLILTVKDKVCDDPQFYSFETLTLFPIDQTLIDFSLLNKKEINWLNTYHKEVENALLPLLNQEEQVWMKHQCKQYES